MNESDKINETKNKGKKEKIRPTDEITVARVAVRFTKKGHKMRDGRCDDAERVRTEMSLLLQCTQTSKIEEQPVPWHLVQFIICGFQFVSFPGLLQLARHFP